MDLPAPFFPGPQQVLDYVGRYTHRVAISNHRLLDVDDGHVRFRYKDYRAAPSQTQKTMTLGATEFIRRFLLHVLPAGFQEAPINMRSDDATAEATYRQPILT